MNEQEVKLKFQTTNSVLRLLSMETKLPASQNFYVHIRILEIDLMQYLAQKFFRQILKQHLTHVTFHTVVKND